MKSLAFEIDRNEDGSWIFQLAGIRFILDGYQIIHGLHFIRNPERAIAYFLVRGNLYGISNKIHTCQTVEDFFGIMRQQHSFFLGKQGYGSRAKKTG